MRAILFALLFAGASAVHAGVTLPRELTGIWVSDGAVLEGDSLTKGQALYIDEDGLGGIIGGNGQEVMGMGVVFTGYDAQTGQVSYNVIENGQVVGRSAFLYDPVSKTIRDMSRRYARRFNSLSPELKKMLGVVIMER